MAHDIADTIEAKVICNRFPHDENHHKWVAWDYRHAGMQNPPPDVGPTTLARCPVCPSQNDYSHYSGLTREK